MRHYNRSRPKRCATVPAGKTDPMRSRVMYSVNAPEGEEQRTCLKEVETAKTCVERERALIKTRAQPGATTSMNGTRRPRSCVITRVSTLPELCPSPPVPQVASEATPAKERTQSACVLVHKMLHQSILVHTSLNVTEINVTACRMPVARPGSSNNGTPRQEMPQHAATVLANHLDKAVDAPPSPYYTSRLSITGA